MLDISTGSYLILAPTKKVILVIFSMPRLGNLLVQVNENALTR